MLSRLPVHKIKKREEFLTRDECLLRMERFRDAWVEWTRGALRYVNQNSFIADNEFEAVLRQLTHGKTPPKVEDFL